MKAKNKYRYTAKLNGYELVYAGTITEQGFQRKIERGDFDFRNFSGNLIQVVIIRDGEMYGEIFGKSFIKY